MLYNIVGELVHSVALTGAPTDKNTPEIPEYEYTLDVSDIASGVYIYVIRAQKGNETLKTKKKLAIIK